MIMANTGMGRIAPISGTLADMMKNAGKPLADRVLEIGEVVEIKESLYQIEGISEEALVLRPLPDTFKL